MRLKITLYLCFLSLTGYSQNYHPFPNPMDTFSFANSEGLVRFITFDSVTTSSGTDIYHLRKEISYEHYSNDSCQGHLHDTAWAGYAVEVSGSLITFKHSDYLLYFNPNSKSTSPIPSGQLFYNNQLFNLTIAFQQGTYRQLFNGVSDSVRTYTLTGIDTSGNLLGGIGGTVFVEISKNHGLLTLPYFFDSYRLFFDYQYRRTDYHLPTRQAIFDFEVGDVYQYLRHGHKFGIGSPQPISPEYEEYEVISKTLAGTDSLYFEMKKTHSKYVLNLTTFQMELKVFHNTIVFGVGRLSELISHQLSNEADSTFPFVHNLWLKDTLWGRDGIVFLNGFFEVNGNCIRHPFEPSNSLAYYNKGLGLTYQEGRSYSTATFHIYELIYFNKVNGQSGGNKVNIGLEELKGDNISFYPNPASSQLHFELKENAEQAVHLFNLAGQLQMTANLTSENRTLNIEKLPAGVYILRTGRASAKFIKL